MSVKFLNFNSFKIEQYIKKCSPQKCNSLDQLTTK